MDKLKRAKNTKGFRNDQPLFYQDLAALKSDIDFTKLSEKELYENVSYPQARDILIEKYEHNPQLWLDQFHNSKVPKIKAALRKLIGRQTLNVLSKQRYLPSSSPSMPVHIITHKKLTVIAQSTKYYQQKDIPLIKVNAQNNDNDNKDNDDDDDNNTFIGDAKIKEIDDEIKQIINDSKDLVIEYAKTNNKNIELVKYEAVQCKIQTVSGINYFIKICINDNQYIHVFIWRKLDQSVEILKIDFDKTESDALIFKVSDNDNKDDDDDDDDDDNDESMRDDPNIFTINADCIDVGCLLQNRGYNPIILNMANENHAGGGWERGSGAQEENLFRRSCYMASLCNTINSFQNKNLFHKKRKWSYPIHEFGCIYSPNVYILRSNESSGYKYLNCPYTLSFIAAAMYRFPKIDEKTRRYKDKDIESNIKRKIRCILRVSYLNGHRCLVMSAWGCGAFRNPPEHQAQLWYQVLNENEFKNAFQCIVFAILDDHNSKKKHNPNGNYQPFADIFGECRLLELY